MNKFSLAIIGSSKIAQIHYKFLKGYNFSKVFFISRSLIKILNFLIENKITRVKTLVKKKINQKNFDVISICNNTNYHQDYLDLIVNVPKLLIIEKPIISIKIFQRDYKIYLKKIYKKFRNIIVVYPMVFLARSILSIVNINSKIKKIEIHYYTSGKERGDEIFIDLSPHALTFFYEICKLNKIKLDKVIKIKIDTQPKIWLGTIFYKDIKLLMNFKKISKREKSKFFVKINNFKIDRITKQKNGIFTNYLEFKKKIILIQNPMKNVFDDAVNSIVKKKLFKKNKDLTNWLMDITEKIYFNKKIKKKII
jgi:flagellar biosynthesis/type III secretory pathway chaperone